MRKGIGILLSSIALFSLIGCTNDESVSETKPQYKVTFLNYDDTFLYETMVFEGSKAYYSGELPTREVETEEGIDSDFEYRFVGWDQDLTAIYSDITTKAIYEYVAKQNWGPIIFP